MSERKDYFCSLPSKQVDAIIDMVCELKVDDKDEQGNKISADEYFQRQCDKALKMSDWIYMRSEEAKELVKAMKEDKRIVLVH